MSKVSQAVLRFFVSPCRTNLAWLPLLLCLGGFALMMYVFYPGNVAAVVPGFTQMRLGIIGDWHAPVTLVQWQFVRWIYQSLFGREIIGTGVIWTFYQILIWGGLFLCFLAGRSYWKKPLPRGAVCLFVLLFCWLCLDLFNDPRNLLKDTGFLGANLMATGLLFNFPGRTRGRVFFAFLIFVLISYATALRHNAIFSALPLIYWLVWKATAKDGRIHGKFNLAVTLALWAVMLAGIHFVNYGLIKAVRLYPLHEIMYQDIFQLNYRTERYIAPPDGFGFEFSRLNEEDFRRTFRPDRLFIESAFAPCRKLLPNPENRLKQLVFDDSVIGDYDRALDEIVKSAKYLEPVLLEPEDPAEIDILSPELIRKLPDDYRLLKKAWLRRIAADPVAYLKFKARVFSKYCRDNSLWFLGLNPLFLSPLALFIAVTGLFSRTERLPGTLLALSALLYLGPLFFFLPDDNQFRYLFWFFAASLLGITHFFAHSPLLGEIMHAACEKSRERCEV